MAMKTKLCIASMNPGKLVELNALLGDTFELLSLQNFGAIPEADEPYFDFLHNAAFKAQYYAQATQMLTLSEDAGLCVEALDGFPGVYTKRFTMNGLKNAYHQLEDLLSLKQDRSAYFTCEAVIYDPIKTCYFRGQGTMTGKITFPPRGEEGFGFDPVFTPNNYTQTIAELGAVVKSKIGHRGKAIRQLLMNYQSYKTMDFS